MNKKTNMIGIKAIKSIRIAVIGVSLLYIFVSQIYVYSQNYTISEEKVKDFIYNVYQAVNNNDLNAIESLLADDYTGFDQSRTLNNLEEITVFDFDKSIIVNNYQNGVELLTTMRIEWRFKDGNFQGYAKNDSIPVRFYLVEQKGSAKIKDTDLFLLLDRKNSVVFDNNHVFINISFALLLPILIGASYIYLKNRMNSNLLK